MTKIKKIKEPLNIGIHPDFIKVQKELPKLEKTAENPFFKSKYVPLDQILEKVLPVLHKYNFALVQRVSHIVVGDNVVPVLKTDLNHITGQAISDAMLLNSKSDSDPQAQGSAITYARRYALVSLLGLATEEDDDANSGSGLKKVKGNYGGEGEKPTEKQVDYMLKLLDKLGQSTTDEEIAKMDKKEVSEKIDSLVKEAKEKSEVDQTNDIPF